MRHNAAMRPKRELEEGADELPRVDLHGLRPEQALRALSRFLHEMRMRGEPHVLVIAGRGWGNREQGPVLLARVEQWLGQEAKRHGVMAFERVHKDGALRLRLARPGGAPPARRP